MAQGKPGRPPSKPSIWKYASVWATTLNQFDRSMDAQSLLGYEPVPGSYCVTPAYFYCQMRKREEKAGAESK